MSCLKELSKITSVSHQKKSFKMGFVASRFGFVGKSVASVIMKKLGQNLKLISKI